MASILNPKIAIASCVKTSTADEDKANDGYKCFEVTATVTFKVYDDNRKDAENQAIGKIDFALS